MNTLYHQHYLLQALKQAQRRHGRTAPNPAVGAVLVKNDQVVSAGFHEGPGHPHAEVVALEGVVVEADMVLYVTLEPCGHQGRTPPCTELILKRGVLHVVFSYLDPNPLVRGKGQAFLRAHGVQCDQISLDSIDQFYQDYAYWHRTGLPWVSCKLAVTPRAEYATADGKPACITGVSAKRFTHQQRLVHQALLTSAQTVLADNPRLNVRLETNTIAKPVYVLDRQNRVPSNVRLVRTAQSLIKITADTKQAGASTASQLVLPVGSTERFVLRDVMRLIGQQGVFSLWVEAGGQLCRSLLSEGLVNQFLLYVSPKALPTLGLQIPCALRPRGESVVSFHTKLLGEDQLFQWCLQV